MLDTETCHFWLGRFPNECVYYEFFKELWDDADDRENTPMTEFARSQDVMSYDYDFTEYGYKPNAKSVADLVRGHSYHEQYTDELTKRAAALGLVGVNAFLFLTDHEIPEPRSVKTDQFEFHYVGTITYRI